MGLVTVPYVFAAGQTNGNVSRINQARQKARFSPAGRSFHVVGACGKVH